MNKKFRFGPIVSPADMWIGFYWSADASKLYFLPVPCLGVSLQFGPFCDVSSPDCTGGYQGKCHCRRNMEWP